ncbi:MAG: GDP-mannose 4,6-dehydratase [Verrucomicrobiota bacterium]
MRRCLVVGHKGQDGRILSSALRARGCHVRGLARGEVDLTSGKQISDLIREEKPDQIYYLAAFHHASEEEITLSDAEVFNRSFAVHLQGAISFLEAIRAFSPSIRFFYAASSHVFGNPPESPQTESTAMNPQNIYGISKAAGIQACRYYRKTHGVFAACGILYNHESPWRAEKFVSRKIVRAAIRIASGERSLLTLGNLSAEIDWGYAPDFVDAMMRTLDLDAAEDFVVATGESHTVREFAELVFRALNLDAAQFLRENLNLIKKAGARLVGDSTQLRKKTGWAPSLSFSEMVRKLVEDSHHVA